MEIKAGQAAVFAFGKRLFESEQSKNSLAIKNLFANQLFTAPSNSQSVHLRQ
jgi:hypothetical protein